jgi:nucleotide-binding universal stress UspA family protein
MMRKFKQLLVSLAFSDYTEGIFNYAADLAMNLDADLTVVSIINDRDIQAVNTISSMGYDVDGEHYVDSIRKERSDLLERYRQAAAFPADRLKMIFRIGNPIVEILKVCAENDVEMVVMGIKGRTDLEHALVGSVAEKMFRRSPVTVVSYRDPASVERLKKRVSRM